MKRLLTDMASPIMKFRNMGASCFVNAGLQAVFALPGFESLRETTATERALIETRHLANETSSAVIPQPMLDLYYERRQEDCGEFLMELLSDCPTVHTSCEARKKHSWPAPHAVIAAHCQQSTSCPCKWPLSTKIDCCSPCRQR